LIDFAPPSHQNKRKYEGPEGHDMQAKVRKTVKDHLIMDQARVLSMTTVICLHAAVAQKSYGSEKRFLCPPPIVRIEGPNAHMAAQQLSMCIVSEDNLRSPPQKAVMDNNLQAAFKHLHVAGTAKQKNFHLALDIATPQTPNLGEGTEAGANKTWASFESAPVTIISKPSKKTAKTRNIGSCILPGGPVSLFNRINSQTVRTKYMTIDHGALCASNASWSAFNVNVINRPPEPPHSLSKRLSVVYSPTQHPTNSFLNLFFD
jgi:recombining binding protein (suppressor of hairless)